MPRFNDSTDGNGRGASGKGRTGIKRTVKRLKGSHKICTCCKREPVRPGNKFLCYVCYRRGDGQGYDTYTPAWNMPSNINYL